MDYVVCYEENGEKKWDIISGEDAMQQFVFALVDESPLVFEMDDELDKKYKEE